MTMKEHNFLQGSPEWHQHRATHFNASDAPAMMGCSPYKTRSQLLHELHTGVPPEVDAAAQARFDAGHRFEALARPLAEQIIGEELFPVVGSDGRLSASFDGITMLGDTVFEHKTLNSTLRACMDDSCTGADLPAMYRVQMEQQLMLAGADRALFMASAWSDDGELVEQRHCWYEPDLDLRKELLQGWQQFATDLESYTPPAQSSAPAEPAHAPEMLPALRVEITGSVVANNLPAFKTRVAELINGIRTDLQTDQDFADAEATVKWCKEGESRIEAAKQHALSQTADVDALFRTMDEVSEMLRSTRLQLDKQVKAEKQRRREELVMDAQAALNEHVASLNTRLGQQWIGRTAGGFADAINGLKSLDSMRDAVAGELARCKIDTSAIADRLQANAASLTDADGRNWMFLFADFATAGLKPAEDFQAIAAQRIAQHQQAQAAPTPRASWEQPPSRAPEMLKREIERQGTDNGRRMKLGELNALWHPISITADGLAELGFQHVATEKSAKLYRASDLPAIVEAMTAHIEAAAALHTAPF